MVLSIYFQAFDKNTLIQLNKAYRYGLNWFWTLKSGNLEVAIRGCSTNRRSQKFPKTHMKTPVLEHLSNKVAAPTLLKRYSKTGAFKWFFEIFKGTFLTKHFQTPASRNYSSKYTQALSYTSLWQNKKCRNI